MEITVAPYYAGRVNHATMDEIAKITDLIWHVDSRVLLSLYIWEVDDDGQRGEAEKNNIVLDGTEKLQKQREQRLEARRARERRAMMSTK